MSNVYPGEAVALLFATQDPWSGEAVAADALPTGTLTKNGVATAASVSIASVVTGLYRATTTIPADAAPGDWWQLSIAATVAGVAARTTLEEQEFFRRGVRTFEPGRTNRFSIGQRSEEDRRIRQVTSDAVQNSDQLPRFSDQRPEICRELSLWRKRMRNKGMVAVGYPHDVARLALRELVGFHSSLHEAGD